MRILPAAKQWLDALPQRFQVTIEGVVGDILDYYGDTLTIAVIGSVAEGVYDDESDVDIFYLRDEFIPDGDIIRIKGRWPLAQFIARTPCSLGETWNHGTVWAWAIKRGMVLYDPQEVLRRQCKHVIPPPSASWAVEIVQRAAVQRGGDRAQQGTLLELGRLWLLLHGVVATTRLQLRQSFETHNTDVLLRTAIKLVTKRTTKEYSQEQRRLLAQATEQLATGVRIAGRSPLTRLA